VAQGRGSKALADALVLAEQKADEPGRGLEAVNRAQRPEVRLPPLAWVAERVATLQEVLERRTERSALLLRKVLGRIRLEPVKPDIGRPYIGAVSTLQPLALLEMDPSPGSEDGSSPLRWWRRPAERARESRPGDSTSTSTSMSLEGPKSSRRTEPNRERRAMW
jgi:hypothetical protein